MTCHVQPVEKEGEVIKPWHGHRYVNRHGVVVVTCGVEVVKQWVLFHYPDYPHVCFCPRRDWPQKFKKVTQ